MDRFSRPGNDDASVLSIGALSRATRIPVETLRTWERRYGFPKPLDREVSGHRRYPLGTVERLRLVAQALELGHKASVALPADVEQLQDLIRIQHPAPPELPPGEFRAPSARTTDHWFSYVDRFDGNGLLDELQRAWDAFGAMSMLRSMLGPFLTELGERWAAKELDVGQEHFASEYIREFLSSKWRPLSERARGPRVVCATLSREQHVLGLHMAAAVIALSGGQVVFLGADTPPREIIVAVTARRSEAVALSAALGCDEAGLRRALKTLRSGLPKGIPVAGGGEGFRVSYPGIELKPDFTDLSEWVRGLRLRRS